MSDRNAKQPGAQHLQRTAFAQYEPQTHGESKDSLCSVQLRTPKLGSAPPAVIHAGPQCPLDGTRRRMNRSAAGFHFSDTLAGMVRVGGFELYSVITGRFRLDGGAMFGVVPKVLWSSHAPPDEHNRIELATRTLIAAERARGRVILIDTGCGTKWAPDHAERFAIEHDADALDRALAKLGFTRSDVTDVVVTHLHFDHNGGLTDWADEPGGSTILRYPNARHWIHRRHWEHARAPHIKDRASFLPHDFEALEGDGVLAFVEGERPEGPLNGWTWLVSHGHTPCQLHPIFQSDTGGVVFAGDLVPTRHHLSPAWVMAYDVEPLRTIDEKIALYERCIAHRLGLAFPHDPDAGGVLISGAQRKPGIAATLDFGMDRAV
jgi:glyoxylase-like metal-dependent hydrolase (beta-lactamase superfamily II)